MWSVGVVSVDSLSQFKAYCSDAVSKQAFVVVEFFAEDAVASFDATVVFGSIRISYASAPMIEC